MFVLFVVMIVGVLVVDLLFGIVFGFVCSVFVVVVVNLKSFVMFV